MIISFQFFKSRPFYCYIELFLFLLFVNGSGIQCRTITDMAGRKVNVPDHITRIMPYDNKTNVILFPVAGNLMVVKARTMECSTLQFISKDFLQLREIDVKNTEEVLKLKPDVIIVAAFIGAGEDLSNYTLLSSKTHIPMVFVDLELMSLDKTYDFLGQLLGKTIDASICANFIRSVFKDAETLKKSKKLNSTVYLANDNNGLRTAPEGSNHAQLFDVMGLQNVAKANLDAKGFACVSIEQVMIWNPDYIFCIGKGETSPYRTVLKSPAWRNITAIKSKHVYPVPSEPYLWFDMPPSINRLVGLIWFSNLFYNQTMELTKQKITEFYRIFYKYNLTDREYNSLFAWK